MISFRRWPSILLVAALCAAGSAWAQEQEPLLGEAKGAKTAADFYERALVAYNMGETRNAFIYLKNALKEDPLLLPAHLLLGKIFLSLGQGEEAEKQLLIADGLGAHRSLIQNSLARAYLMQGRPQQLIDELFPMGSAPEEDAELLALRGEAHLELDEYFEAQRAFTQAWEKNPRSVPAILGRVQVMLLEGELEKASALAAEAVEIAPTNPRAWYLKGVLANSLGDYSGALADYTRAAKELPAYLPAQIARVGVLLRLNRVEEAARVADDVRAIYPNDPRSHFLEAVVQTRLGDTKAAEAALTDAQNLIARLPRELIDGHLPTLLLAGVVSFSLKQWEQAGDYLDLYLAADPGSTGARVLLARIKLEQLQQPEEAIALLEPAVERSPDNVQAKSLLAESYMQSGQHLKAAQMLRAALEEKGDDVVLRTQRAVNEFGLGRRGNAVEELSAILSNRPDLTSAGATLVVMQLQEHAYDDAVASARSLMLNDPGNLTYVNLFGAALFAQGDLDTAAWAFQLALVIDPGFYPARQNLAELLLQRGDTDLARGHLEHIIEQAPREAPALALLARSYEGEGDLKRALEITDQALDVDPGSVDIAVYQTELLLKLREPDQAVRVAESIEVRAGNPDDAELLATLSRAYIASGRRAAAQVVLRRGSSVAGYDARKLHQVALLQREAGDLDGALWSLQKATDGDPGYLPTRMSLAEMLIELDRSADAALVAEGFAKDFPNEPYAEHIMGLIHRKRGDQAAALASFRAALAKKPSPLLAIRVFETQREAEGEAQAVAFLEGWVAEHPDDGISAQTLAQGYYDLGRTDDARVLFEKTLASAPDNPLLLNNLAMIYAESGDKRALDLARKAHDLLPNAPEIGDTLGWVLVRQGDLAEGLKYLRDAQSRAASDAGISYHIAYALHALGRTDEAIDELTRGLQGANDDDAETRRAHRLLDELRASEKASSQSG